MPIDFNEITQTIDAHPTLSRQIITINGVDYQPTGQSFAGKETSADVIQSIYGDKRLLIKPLESLLLYNPEEARAIILRKYNFFQVVHNDAVLIADETLSIPFKEGILGIELTFDNIITKIKYVLAVLNAAIEMQAKGIVHMDIKEDNVIYNPNLDKVYFIDGGLATNIKEPLPGNFQRPKALRLKFLKHKHPHYAPECWSEQPQPADIKMDNYSLGVMLLHKFNEVFYNNIDETLHNILVPLTNISPEDRPNLETVYTQVNNLLLVAQAEQDAARRIEEKQEEYFLNYEEDSKEPEENVALKYNSFFSQKYYNTSLAPASTHKKSSAFLINNTLENLFGNYALPESPAPKVTKRAETPVLTNFMGPEDLIKPIRFSDEFEYNSFNLA